MWVTWEKAPPLLVAESCKSPPPCLSVLVTVTCPSWAGHLLHSSHWWQCSLSCSCRLLSSGAKRSFSDITPLRPNLSRFTGFCVLAFSAFPSSGPNPPCYSYLSLHSLTSQEPCEWDMCSLSHFWLQMSSFNLGLRNSFTPSWHCPFNQQQSDCLGSTASEGLSVMTLVA